MSYYVSEMYYVSKHRDFLAEAQHEQLVKEAKKVQPPKASQLFQRMPQMLKLKWAHRN